jgi:hypothetical protein
MATNSIPQRDHLAYVQRRLDLKARELDLRERELALQERMFEHKVACDRALDAHLQGTIEDLAGLRQMIDAATTADDLPPVMGRRPGRA